MTIPRLLKRENVKPLGRKNSCFRSVSPSKEDYIQSLIVKSTDSLFWEDDKENKFHIDYIRKLANVTWNYKHASTELSNELYEELFEKTGVCDIPSCYSNQLADKVAIRFILPVAQFYIAPTADDRVFCELIKNNSGIEFPLEDQIEDLPLDDVASQIDFIIHFMFKAQPFVGKSKVYLKYKIRNESCFDYTF